MYDDFIELRPGAAREMEAHLNGSGTTSTAVRINATTESSTLGSSSNSTLADSQSQDAPSVPSSYDPQKESHELNPAVIQCGPDGRWLLVCAKTREAVPTLDQMDVCTTSSDRELFAAMRKSYLALRGRWKHVFSLRTITSIKFVRVELLIITFSLSGQAN
jgi:hypothetical protein